MASASPVRSTLTVIDAVSLDELTDGTVTAESHACPSVVVTDSAPTLSNPPPRLFTGADKLVCVVPKPRSSGDTPSTGVSGGAPFCATNTAW